MKFVRILLLAIAIALASSATFARGKYQGIAGRVDKP
jgi:hypothetical protein